MTDSITIQIPAAAIAKAVEDLIVKGTPYDRGVLVEIVKNARPEIAAAVAGAIRAACADLAASGELRAAIKDGLVRGAAAEAERFGKQAGNRAAKEQASLALVGGGQ